jgi:hypothetical protein
MKSQKESPAGQQEQSCKRQNEGNEYSPKRQIRKLFYDGGRYTARQLNRLTCGNDARKHISDIRAQGMSIVDIWLDNPRCKLYWWDRTPEQTLFGHE